MLKKSSLFVILFSVLLLVVSCKDNPSDGNNSLQNEYLQINTWIQANMDFFYFWNELVPEGVDGNQLPQEYFESMLEPDDVFSYMSDDAKTLLEELDGSSFTAGFSPAFGAFSNSNNVFIIVQFVYPDSPAEEAGLKRGDIILAINGTQLNRDNYLDLYYDESDATYTLGIYDPEENAISQGETITVTKKELELDPVIYTSVIENGSHKIGYLFYAQFLVGGNDQFIESVDNVLAEFEAQGITELVVDLRYNPGGRITAASNLANSIAPPSVVSNNSVFVRYEYNQNLTDYFIENQGLDSPNLVAKFSEDPVNLNLNRAYFLTTSRSASASELLINGLDPYMDVISVGTSTFGKFYGSFVLDGNESTPPNNYALVPVSLKYANADGVTDFRDGLIPDHEATENLFQPKPIGDTSDPLLAKALSLITGDDEPTAKQLPAFHYQKLDDIVQLKRGNIFFERMPPPRN